MPRTLLLGLHADRTPARLRMHSKARLSDADRALLRAWAETSGASDVVIPSAP
jgi:hypothetical protein